MRWERPRQAPGEHMPSFCWDPQVGDTQSPDGAGCRGWVAQIWGSKVQKLLPKGSSQNSDCGHALAA